MPPNSLLPRWTGARQGPDRGMGNTHRARVLPILGKGIHHHFHLQPAASVEWWCTGAMGLPPRTALCTVRTRDIQPTPWVAIPLARGFLGGSPSWDAFVGPTSVSTRLGLAMRMVNQD